MKLDKRAIKIQEELSDRILRLTDNGEEMVQFYLGLLRDSSVSLKYRMEAAKWLSDRSWGKEPTVLHVDSSGFLDGLMQATDSELLGIAASISKLPSGALDFNLEDDSVIGRLLPERLDTDTDKDESRDEDEDEDENIDEDGDNEDGYRY